MRFELLNLRWPVSIKSLLRGLYITELLESVPKRMQNLPLDQV
jgi:hypothetical protein